MKCVLQRAQYLRQIFTFTTKQMAYLKCLILRHRAMHEHLKLLEFLKIELKNQFGYQLLTINFTRLCLKRFSTPLLKNLKLQFSLQTRLRVSNLTKSCICRATIASNFIKKLKISKNLVFKMGNQC